MDNKQVTAEWIAQQRKKYCGNVKYKHDFYALTADELREVREAIKAALDALEAAMRREAEKDATIIRLTAERDTAVKIIRDARVYLDELGSPQYCLYQLMKWPCDENGGEKDDH